MTGLTTGIDEPPVLETALSMPYTLTPGKAAGSYLAELANERILGSRTPDGRVTVPPREYVAGAGPDEWEFVELAGPGTIVTLTRTADGAFALIRLDGADNEILHRVVGDLDAAAPGVRVVPVWSEGDEILTKLAGFAVSSDEPDAGAARAIDDIAEPFLDIEYSMTLNYRHSYGSYYGRMFDELGATGRILGSRTKRGEILVPPRANCDASFTAAEQFVDVPDTGVLQAFSVIHMEFVGQTRTPPYIYGEIILDGTATRLIHNVAGIDIATADENLAIGTRVRAVWRPESERTGTLNDIDYFEPIAGEIGEVL